MNIRETILLDLSGCLSSNTPCGVEFTNGVPEKWQKKHPFEVWVGIIKGMTLEPGLQHDWGLQVNLRFNWLCQVRSDEWGHYTPISKRLLLNYSMKFQFTESEKISSRVGLLLRTTGLTLTTCQPSGKCKLSSDDKFTNEIVRVQEWFM